MNKKKGVCFGKEKLELIGRDIACFDLCGKYILFLHVTSLFPLRNCLWFVAQLFFIIQLKHFFNLCFLGKFTQNKCHTWTLKFHFHFRARNIDVTITMVTVFSGTLSIMKIPFFSFQPSFVRIAVCFTLLIPVFSRLCLIHFRFEPSILSFFS